MGKQSKPRRHQTPQALTQVNLNLSSGLRIKFSKQDLAQWNARIAAGEHFLDAARNVIEANFPGLATAVITPIVQLEERRN